MTNHERELSTVHGDVAQRDLRKELHIHIHLPDGVDEDTVHTVISTSIKQAKRWL